MKFFKRKQIDASFRAMACDTSYQEEARIIAEEFIQSDWETLAKHEH